MGVLMKLIDAVLFLFFLTMAIVAPLFDAQACLPRELYPDVLVNLKNWYARDYGDYLVTENPPFFVGLVWLELCLAWPLSVVNLYGIATGKSWVKTVCLICGTSTSTGKSWVNKTSAIGKSPVLNRKKKA